MIAFRSGRNKHTTLSSTDEFVKPQSNCGANL